MKYAIRFYRGCRVLDKADEIIIKYTETEPELIKFVQSCKNIQRVIVLIPELIADAFTLEDNQEEDIIEENIRIFSTAMEAHPEFAVMLDQDHGDWIERLEKAHIPFFFCAAATSKTEFRYMLNYDVSDIYIGGELGFSMKEVADVCHSRGIKIRVVPNFVYNPSQFAKKFDITNFFIRPEDTEFYEQYVDIFEFRCRLTQQPVYYDIYHDGRWLGNLQDIIINLEEDIDNRTILPQFQKRANCGKRCAFGKCDICSHILTASELMVEKGLVLVPPKRQYDNELEDDTVAEINEAFAGYE